MQRNAVIAMAILTVGILAAAGIGVGLAYQATYTDQTSSESNAVGQYLKIADGTDPTSNPIDSIPSTSTPFYLNAGIDIDNSNGNPVYYWDLTDANLTTDVAGKIVVKKSEVVTQGADQTTATVRALFYIGAYDVTSPQSINDATISIEKTIGQPTGNVPTTKVILKEESYTASEAEALDLSSLVEVTSLNGQGLSTTSSDYFVYILAEWTVPQPTAGTESTVVNQLVLPTVSIKMTATATDFE